MRLYVSCRFFILVAAFHIPSSAVAQTDVDCVAIFDALGDRVARVVTAIENSPAFYIENNGFAFPFRLKDQLIYGTRDALYFADSTCSGTPYLLANGEIPPSPSPVSVAHGPDVYYAEPDAPQVSIGLGGRRRTDTWVCEGSGLPGGANGAWAAQQFFVIPKYQSPFTIEPEACFVPPPMVTALTPYSLGAMALMLAFGAYVLRKRHSATVEID
jgi:hypothetical protein